MVTDVPNALKALSTLSRLGLPDDFTRLDARCSLGFGFLFKDFAALTFSRTGDDCLSPFSIKASNFSLPAFSRALRAPSRASAFVLPLRMACPVVISVTVKPGSPTDSCSRSRYSSKPGSAYSLPTMVVGPSSVMVSMDCTGLTMAGFVTGFGDVRFHVAGAAVSTTSGSETSSIAPASGGTPGASP